MEEDITLRIAKEIRSKGLTLRTSFLIFDRDGDKELSYEEFEATVNGTLNLREIKELDLKWYFGKQE